jgi:hypothetical protein
LKARRHFEYLHKSESGAYPLPFAYPAKAATAFTARLGFIELVG